VSTFHQLASFWLPFAMTICCPGVTIHCSESVSTVGKFLFVVFEPIKHLHFAQGFFRRSVKERDCLKYQCLHSGTCTITSQTRNVCKACRYNRCLRVGMKPESMFHICCCACFLCSNCLICICYTDTHTPV